LSLYRSWTSVPRRETRTRSGTVDTRAQTSVKIKSDRAVAQDEQERAVPLVVYNISSEGPLKQVGGHTHGPRKGQLDGLADERASSVPVSKIGSEGIDQSSREDLATTCGPGLAEADAGRVLKVDESKGCKASRIECSVASNGTPALVHQWHRQETSSVALDLQFAVDSAEVRSKRPRKTLADSGETIDKRGHCPTHRQRTPAAAIPRHRSDSTRRDSNRSCRVHGRRRDRSRGKATERQIQSSRDLTANELECSVIRLEQDPILEPVRILGCPPAEGLEISSFLEPAPNCLYPTINVGRIATTEAACFSLYEPNIQPKSRVDSIAKILEGPNRAVKDINRKILAMARAMAPAWSLRLLSVSCGSVVCAWGLLLILSVLGGGASHGTALGSFGLGSLSGTMEDMNSVRCPWLCTCNGQEVECSHRGLTQIPENLATLLLAEKL
ncbi:uncharacterized protein LOC128894494, partial [Hylaeus anthracinus]|uniref:uncharacterized protein LOC128894494 n=1 Tax=Hylaeus anthracinus TaxID=313031 RepID=UPI0023B99B04